MGPEVPSAVMVYTTVALHMHLVVPYIARAYWSLFILDHEHMYHLDSVGAHYDDNDKQFVAFIRGAWEVVHDPLIQVQPGYEAVNVYLQKGNYKCGFHVLQNIELFCRQVESNAAREDASIAEDSTPPALSMEEFREQVLKEFSVSTLQVTIMEAIADELKEGLGLESKASPYIEHIGDIKFADDSSPIEMRDNKGNLLEGIRL